MATEKLARQLTSWPTRKLGVGVAVASGAAQFWHNVAPDYFPALAGQDIALLVGFLVSYGIGLIVGYFVKDRPNIAEEGED